LRCIRLPISSDKIKGRKKVGNNKYFMLIDGKWIEAESKATFEVKNPATEETIAEVPKGDKVDAKKALKAADRAFPEWANIPPNKRAHLLRETARLIREREDKIARILTSEQGKPLNEARSEIKSAADAIEYFAEEAYRMRGEIIPTNSAKRKSLVIKQPVGVVAAIGPWNYPVSLLSWKVGPALIAGCTVVVKPASLTPLSVIEFIHCFVDAGVPSGVINLVTGPGKTVGEELVKNPLSRKIAFTGETATGKRIIQLVADGVKRVSLELGGSCPLIVCDDADLSLAVKGGVYRAFRNMGQVCNSINRIYVDTKLFDEFVEEFVKETKKLRIGNGLEEPDIDLGPMVSDEQRRHVIEHIEDAVKKGAKIECGGKIPEGEKFKKGFFFEPTVLTGVNHKMRVMREETFGPVAPIMAVKDVEEAIKLANDSPYGLVGYVYTKDIKRAFRVAESLECGTVGINNVSGGEFPYPYGGWKESGIGLELSNYGVEEYLQVKHVRIDIGY